MTERYPGYDVLSKRAGVSWNDPTRRVIDHRLTVAREPRFFSPEEWAALEALCRRILPQPESRPEVPLAAYVDEKMFEGRTDGFRHAELPHQGPAWRQGLAGLDAAAESLAERTFAALSPEQQDLLIRRLQRGELTGKAWGGMPSQRFFEARVLPDITAAYYAHPTAWSEIGFGGPASPRGYVRMALDRRDSWEAAEGKPGEEARARRENLRVR
jgi:hypothetical protein